MNKWKRALLLLSAAAVVLFPAAAILPQALAGKPAPPPPPPPVRYRLTWLGTFGGVDSEAADINNQGEVVGWALDTAGTRRAFLFTLQNGLVDLNVAAPISDGWIARKAYGINELGQIVGYADKAGEAFGRAFFYDPTVSPPRTVLLPTGGPGTDSARSVNLFGVVVATHNDPDYGTSTIVYTPVAGSPPTWTVQEISPIHAGPRKINDGGQVLDYSGDRFTPAVGWETFDWVANAWGMNEDGAFVGRTFVKKGIVYGPPMPNGSSYAAFRFTEDPDQVKILVSGSAAYGADINLSGDVCGRYGSRSSFVYTDAKGALLLDSLVIGDASDIAVWTAAWLIDPAGINDRDTLTGFGAICGKATFLDAELQVNTYSAFLLSPERP